MRYFFVFPFILFAINQLFGQEEDRKTIGANPIHSEIRIDGILDESDWINAEASSEFLAIVPREGALASQKTEVRILVDQTRLIVGVRCFDSSIDQVVKYSKLRDPDLKEEDHIRLVLDPFLDGQSGYIFAVNAFGARYDALVSNRGESENSNWDAVWDAAVHIGPNEWSLELELPIQSINFKKGLRNWGFNIERRIQRNQETIRWTNIRRDQWFIQTSRAGLLTGLPDFHYGLGLTIRPSLVVSSDKAGSSNTTDYSLNPSLDAQQRIGPNILTSLTINTDFAETDVDTRQTNLTRFPLFFPERRSFFLEGSDIFEFGFGTGRQVMLPFFSRRIGLLKGQEVPIRAGLKLNGRVGKTAFGALSVRTGEQELNEGAITASNMHVLRVRQNVFAESSVGVIAAAGDPLARANSYMAGADFTYQTTRFRGNKNFIAGAWLLQTGREDLVTDRSAYGFKFDYPNDLWDISFTYARIGEGFDPSLGFVPRRGIRYLRYSTTYAPRPDNGWLRQMFNQLFVTHISHVHGPWQSYGVFTAPINWRLESGDHIEANVYPQGENLQEPFELAKGVQIPVGAYHFVRYRLETIIASKRKLNGQLTWWFGDFYTGNLDVFETELNWNPGQLVAFEWSSQYNRGRMPEGDFDQVLLGFKLRFNVNSNLQLNSFIQYDTESKILGWNARIHWIFNPLGEVFLVVNNNAIRNLQDRWELQNRQVLLKARYNFRW